MHHIPIRCFLLPLLALAACGEPIQDDHFANDVREARQDPPAARIEAVPVRVGELGPNFPACNAAAVTRNLDSGQSLPVRAAPFDGAAETGRIPASARFIICSRSHDQKWFGIVYNDAGSAARCGVSQPSSTRRAYEGPCKSGWVSAPFVKFTAGAEDPQLPVTKAE